MSPESIKMTHRHSEAGNMVMLGDGSMGDAPEDLYHHMQLAYPNPRYQGSVTNVSVLSSSQASPSSSSLSSTHSAPSQMITSAPSSARGKDGRVLLAEWRREVFMNPTQLPVICDCVFESSPVT
nr:dedicator of cytokinesis protein 3-like isoform X2 [Chlorocebus sabaeus]